MRPPLNSEFYNPSSGIQINGSNFPGHQQIRPQFHLGMPNNHQPTMPSYSNLNNQFSTIPFIPFPPVGLQNSNANLLPMLHPHYPANNLGNMPQFLSNGQLNAQSLLHSANQILQMQMQMANLGPQALGLILNTQLGVANGTCVLQQGAGGNALSHISPTANDFGSSDGQQNPNMSRSGSAKLQNTFMKEMNDKSGHPLKSQNDIIGNNKHNDPRKGYGRKQIHDRQFSKGLSKFNSENRDRGKKNFRINNFNPSFDQSQSEKKSSLTVLYTEKEIKLWREERRKNYPTTANVEKRLNEIPAQVKTKEADAEVRRQQLKEVLAKQVELGCEVAEIPSHYLSDSETPRKSNEQNNQKNGKRGRFGSKNGKFPQKGRFGKRQKFETAGPRNLQNENDGSRMRQIVYPGQKFEERTKEPSLLAKLLSSDIKKDKKHLLQAFRFMVMNSFFKNFSEQPLKFPNVIVKESDVKGEAVVREE